MALPTSARICARTGFEVLRSSSYPQALIAAITANIDSLVSSDTFGDCWPNDAGINAANRAAQTDFTNLLLRESSCRRGGILRVQALSVGHSRGTGQRLRSQ